MAFCTIDSIGVACVVELVACELELVTELALAVLSVCWPDDCLLELVAESSGCLVG